MGPILFILYINDICNVSNILKLILFADDTNLFRTGPDLNTLCNELTCELKKLYTWFNVNKLSLNISKTKFMVFSNKTVNADIKICINEIESVVHTKFLGILIDNRVTWKPHIAYLKGKLSKSLAVLYRCSRLINQTSLRSIYCSLFLSQLTYCCEVWGTTYKSNLNCLKVLQKKAVRVICNEDRLSKSTPLFLKLNLLKFEDIVNVKCCLVTYLAQHLDLPSNL